MLGLSKRQEEVSNRGVARVGKGQAITRVRQAGVSLE